MSRLPVPNLTLAEVAFPTNPPLPKWETLPDEFRLERHPYCEVAQQLFFKGGKLSDFGLRFRDDIDKANAMGALKACLGSFSPKHEHKIAGVG